MKWPSKRKSQNKNCKTKENLRASGRAIDLGL